MKLYKKNVYCYILDLLMTGSGELIPGVDDKLIFDQESLSLPNVKIEEKKIVISDYKEYEAIVDQRIQQVVNHTLELTNADADDNELEQEYLKIKNLKQGYNAMKEYYIQLGNIFKQLNEDDADQLLLIEAMIVNKQTNQSSEFIAKAVNLSMNGTNFEINVEAQPQLVLDPKSNIKFDISLVRKLRGENSEVFYSKLSHEISKKGIEVDIDLSSPRIVLRKVTPNEMQATIIDYKNIISQLDDNQVLDETDFIDQVAIFESEIEALNSVPTNFYNVLPMSCEQMQISHFIKTENLAIEGPAGTGKTHSVINVIADRLAADKTILVASENVQTIECIYQMLPPQLQDFVITNYHDSNFSFNHLEMVLRNLIANVDTINITQLETRIEELQIQRRELITNIRSAQDQWIANRVHASTPVIIEGLEKSYKEWIQTIDFAHVMLDDCLIPELSISKQEIENIRKLALIKPLKHEVINFEQLPTSASLQPFTHVFDKFEKLSFNGLVNLELPHIGNEFITTNCNQLLDHWYKSESEYKKDCQDIKRLTQLAKQQVENIGLLTDYKVKLPSGSSIRDLEKFLDDYYDQYKLLTYTRIRHHKVLNLTINGQSYRDFDDGIEILDKYLSQQQAKHQFKQISDRFEQYLGSKFTIKQLETICQQFAMLKQVDSKLTNSGIELFETCLTEELNIFETYAQITNVLPIAKRVDQLVELIVNTEKASELHQAADKFISRLSSGQSFSFEYKKLSELLVEQNQIHCANVTLDNLKQIVDQSSPSLYEKITNQQCDGSIVDHWADNFIYTKLLEVKTELNVSVELDNRLLEVNTAIIVNKLWLTIAQKISKQERLTVQVIIALINKLELASDQEYIDLTMRLNEQLNQLTNLFPIWFSTRLHLPLIIDFNSREKFDLVIYDEGSDSSIEGLNILERGNRKLILGDYRQVSPNYQPDHEVAVKIKKNYQLSEIIDYDTSILSYAQANYKTLSLSKQYRANPDVIEFSNNQFYKQNLNIVKPRSIGCDGNSVESYYCKDASCDNEMINVVEADQLVSYLKRAIALPENNSKSIGVISLHGQAQAELIKTMLYKEVNMMSINNQIKFGEVSEFRNSEFDIIVLSLVVDDSKLLISSTAEQQRINLAMSRAKGKQVLFYSLDPNQMNDYDNIYYKLITYFTSKTNKSESATNAQVSSLSMFGMFEEMLRSTGYKYQFDINSVNQDIKLIIQKEDSEVIVIVRNHQITDHKQITDSYQEYKQYLDMDYKLLILDELDLHTDTKMCIEQIINI